MVGGFLRVVSERQLQAAEEVEAAQQKEVDQALSDDFKEDLAAHIRRQFDEFSRHRTGIGFDQRLQACYRAYNGEYDPQKLSEIKSFGGSDVYARLTAIKCRGATAMLRDVYLSGQRPWAVEPSPVPQLPDDILESVGLLVSSEVETLMQGGQPPDPSQVAQRRTQLIAAARRAARKSAREAAARASDKLDDYLVEGGFYEALGELLIELPITPVVFLKGPEVRMERRTEWRKGKAKAITGPVLTWRRVSPWDLFWTPGASTLQDADVIERLRLRRSDIQALRGVPGYDDNAIFAVLEAYPTGLSDISGFESGAAAHADVEGRENPTFNGSGYLDALEYQGEVAGSLLKEWNGGRAVEAVPDFDERLVYCVSAWLVGRFCIKVQIQPNPRLRHNYFSTVYEPVPGSIAGRPLTEILVDSQHVANSAFRSLVNNMSMASGPQVAINEDRLSPSCDGDSIYPWKRWRFVSDPLGNSEKPVDFFQPQSNAESLMNVFEKMMMLSDEVSGIPRYLTGNQNVGGAAATASGLNQLMNNASKVLQQVAAQLDRDILDPVLKSLYEMLLLTDKDGFFVGDENIAVRGVTMAAAREADRQRQLEFLQITANPIDQEIIGSRGRVPILRTLADGLGLDGEQVVPSDEDLDALQQQQQEMAAAQQEMAAQAQGAQAPKPGPSDQRPARGLDNAQRTRTPQAIANQTQP